MSPAEAGGSGRRCASSPRGGLPVRRWGRGHEDLAHWPVSRPGRRRAGPLALQFLQVRLCASPAVSPAWRGATEGSTPADGMAKPALASHWRPGRAASSAASRSAGGRISRRRSGAHLDPLLRMGRCRGSALDRRCGVLARRWGRAAAIRPASACGACRTWRRGSSCARRKTRRGRTPSRPRWWRGRKPRRPITMRPFSGM